MSNFRTGCGAALNEGAKFCKTCGTKTSNLGKESLSKFLSYLFETMFSLVPFMSKTETPPADPPFFADKNS